MTQDQIVATVNKSLAAAGVSATVEATADEAGLITVEVDHETYLVYELAEPQEGFEWGVIGQYGGGQFDPPETDYERKGTSTSCRNATDNLVRLLVELRLAQARLGEWEDVQAEEDDRVDAELVADRAPALEVTLRA